MFLFKSCCCAFSLKTGTLMVGYLSLFIRVCFVIVFGTMMEFSRIHSLAVAGAQKDARGLMPNEEVYMGCSLYPEEKSEYLSSVPLFNRSDLPRKNETEYDEGYLAAVIGFINFDRIRYHASNLLFLDPLTNQTETYIDQSNSRSRRSIDEDIRIEDPDMLAEVFGFEVLLGRVVLNTISVITSIVLIIGAVKGCVRLLLPWITSEMLIIILNIVIMVTHLSGSYNGKRETILAQFFLISLYIFMLLVAMSHCKELERKEQKSEVLEMKKSYPIQV